MNHLRRVDRPPAIAMWDFSWLDRCRPSAACQDRDLVEFIAKCAARDLRLGPSTLFQNDTTQYCVMPGYATIREATLHYIKKPGSKARPTKTNKINAIMRRNDFPVASPNTIRFPHT